MDFLNNIGQALSGIWNSISSGFSSMTSSIGSFFGGSGSGGGSTAGPVAAATLAAGMAVSPAPSVATPSYAPGYTAAPNPYPSPVANPYAVNNAGGQVLGALNSAATQVLGRMGTAGAVLSPMVDATMRVSDMQMRANQNGAISCAPPGQPMGPTPNLNGAFSASCGAYQARMAAANEAGANAMLNRGINQAVTVGANILVGRHLPSTNGNPGGAFGNLLSKIGR